MADYSTLRRTIPCIVIWHCCRAACENTYTNGYADITPEETINKKNLRAIDELVVEDFIEYVPFPGQGPGRDGLKQAVGALVSAFPDMYWTIDEQIAEGEKVVSRFTMTGTHQGEFLGMAPKGASINVWGVDCRLLAILSHRGMARPLPEVRGSNLIDIFVLRAPCCSNPDY